MCHHAGHVKSPATAATAWNLLVRRDDLSTAELADAPVPQVRDGEALLRVDRVGLTANNVTYAALGDSFRYWEFFPAPRAGWGIVPLWGFADVVASRVEAHRDRQPLLRLLPIGEPPAGAPRPGGRTRLPRGQPPSRAAAPAPPAAGSASTAPGSGFQQTAKTPPMPMRTARTGTHAYPRSALWAP